jgi:hypothetical protein
MLNRKNVKEYIELLIISVILFRVTTHFEYCILY